MLNAKQVFSLLPEPLDTEYFELFKEFEEGESMEAKLGQAIEKVESQLQHLNSGPEFWSEAERGLHMLNYPNKVLKKLNDKNMNEIWQKIRDEIEKLN